VGRFSSMGRRDKTPSDTTQKTTSKGSESPPGKDQAWSTASAGGSTGSTGSANKDQQSQKRESASGTQTGAQGGNSMATIGQSIVFKGELSGDEDLEIDGQVEGTVHLKNHLVTIGPNGNLKAEVTAKTIVVIGKVTGNLIAAERIEIQATGIVDGDVRAPRLNIQEGAVLNGSIDMSASGSTSEARKPATTPSASATAVGSSSATAPA
jgi:cytoskeletal protein CcmA (bactofilin family)